MSIVDAQGAVVASYEYDPYGNLISDEPAENTIGHLNPLRYRGYYYDSESGFYYLQSRYYDPAIGRFINADTFASTGQGILGNNMFAYCNNNPANCLDPGGNKRKFWHQLFEDRDPGYIHRAVQVHILSVENARAIIFKTELIIPGIGRVDLVCPETNEIWEIKYGGSDDQSFLDGISAANKQLDGYIKDAALKKGSAGRFNGVFTINYDSSTYVVVYTTPEPGVVIYVFAITKTPSAQADFVYSPYTLYQEQKNLSLAQCLVFGFMGCPSGPIMAQEYIYDPARG